MSLQYIILIVFLLLIGVFSSTVSLIGARERRRIEEGLPVHSNWLVRAHDWVFGTKKAQEFQNPEDALRQKPKRWVLNVVFALALLGLLIYMNLDLNLGSKFNFNIKWNDIGSILNNLFHPDWDYFFGVGIDNIGVPYTFKVSVVYQIFQTFGIAFVGTLLAALVALPFGLLGSHKMYGRWAWVSDVILILIRTFPELLLGIIMVIMAGTSPLTGVIAIGFHSIGMIGKLYADQFDDVNFEPLESLSASGAGAIQRIHLGLLPEARPGLFSVALYRFDINVRTATILGVVCGDGCGIGYSLSSLNLYTDASKLGACLFGVIILIVIIDLLSSWIRKKLI